MALDEGPL